MSRVSIAFALAAGLVDATVRGAQQEPSEPPSQALDTIVMIGGEFAEGPTAGAGLVFGGDRKRLLVVTAAHLVRRRSGDTAGRLEVQLRSQQASLPARFTGHADADLDIAVLEVPNLQEHGVSFCDQPFGWFAASRTFPVRWAEDVRLSNAVRRGATVYPIGHPNGMGWLTPATPDRIVEASEDLILFQSTFIAPGHSGGALMIEGGEIVGLIQADQPPLGRARHIASVFETLRAWGYPVAGHWPGAAHRSIREGDLGELRRLLDAGGCAVTRELDGSGRTPLGLAASFGSRAEVELLLTHGADAGRTGDRVPPLALASGAADRNIVELLLKAGADVHEADGSGKTALFYAVIARSAAIVKVLLAAGDDVNHQTSDGETPLIFAVRREDVPLVRLLLDAGAEVNVQSRWGVSPLSLVADRKTQVQREIYKLLEAAGARTVRTTVMARVRS